VKDPTNVVHTTIPPKAESNSTGVFMKTIRAAFALTILAVALAGMPALAQDHQDQDHRQNHLRRPPAGHEWRQIDGNYVMARQDGTIVSVRHASHDQ